MRARQFAICDSDRQYLSMLQAYLQKRKLADFEILVFDAVDKAVEEIKRCGISVQAQTTEEKDFVCYTIRVPKNASARPAQAGEQGTASA